MGSGGQQSSQSLDMMMVQEEYKHFVPPAEAIEEEASSGSSNDQQATTDAGRDNVTAPTEGRQKKSSILSKVRRGLRKLSINSHKKKDEKELGGLEMAKSDAIKSPKSAQLREPDKYKLGQ